MKNSAFFLSCLLFLLTGCIEPPEKIVTIINNQEFVTGLKSPIGMVIDHRQNLWVTESGTGNNDSQLIIITPAGRKHVVVEGFPSMIREQENIPVGLHHIIIRNNKILLVHSSGDGDGSLYTLDISGYKIGSTPIKASSLEKVDISTFIKKELKAEYSNPYDIISGPNEEILIVDAGANAILKIDKNGNQSIMAEIQGIQNPTPIGPPSLEPVPTNISWDGNKYLITTLNGFPFPQGYARILQMDVNGNVSEYKGGFNSLTGITQSPSNRPVVIEYATFVPGPPGPGAGWQDKTGKLKFVGNDEPIVLLDGLTTPTAVVSSKGFYYVNSFKEGKILKIKAIGT